MGVSSWEAKVKMDILRFERDGYLMDDGDVNIVKPKYIFFFKSFLQGYLRFRLHELPFFDKAPHY